VDLDGAVQGEPVNRDVIKKIIKDVPIPIQLGGGIRDMRVIEVYLELGISQVILGTVAYKDPAFVSLACKKFPGRIILAIDAKKDHVSVEGWTEDTDMTPAVMARRYEKVGISTIIHTDIDRDGMNTGLNIKATKILARSVKVPVIASGGISGIDDVAKVLTLSEYGVIGMITGRALYQGTLNLAEAIGLAKEQGKRNLQNPKIQP